MFFGTRNLAFKVPNVDIPIVNRNAEHENPATIERQRRWKRIQFQIVIVSLINYLNALDISQSKSGFFLSSFQLWSHRVFDVFHFT